MAKTASYNVTDTALMQGTNTISVTSYVEGLGESAQNTVTYGTGDTGYVLQYELNPAGNAYLCTGRGELELSSIEIPATHEGLPVIGIAASAFEDDKMIRSIAVSYRLEYIGEDAFKNSSIRDITFPAGTMLKEIDSGAFQRSDLESIEIPLSVTTIGESAFSDCQLLRDVTFAGKQKRIYFRNTLGLSNIKYNYVLSNGNTRSGSLNIHENDGTCDIYTYAFPSNVVSITFSGTQLNSDNIISLPPLTNLTTAFEFGTCYEIQMSGASMVWNMYNYSPKTDPDAGYNMTIKSHAFSGCHTITEIDFTYRLFDIEANAMSNCVGLTKVNFGERLKYISESAFEGCSALVDVTFGKQMQRIESCAFKDCSSLEIITFPESLDWIGKKAFAGCNSLSIADFLCDVGWLYTLYETAETGTGIASSLLLDPRNGASYLTYQMRDYNWIRITKMLPPEIRISGETLSITDYTDLAEKFYIYVNGTRRAIISANENGI